MSEHQIIGIMFGLGLTIYVLPTIFQIIVILVKP